MNPIHLPPGYTLYGSSNNGDTVTAYADNSTTAQPRFVIIDRRRPVFDASTGRFSVLTYRIRSIFGTIDSDGRPLSERVLADTTFRVPVGNENELGDLITVHLSMLNDENLEESVSHTLLPSCCEVVEGV